MQPRYASGMPISLKQTPPGVCDNCGRACQGLHEVDHECYHCHAGTFIHRSLWEFSECPACAGQNDPLCEFCHSRGVLASPKESVAGPETPSADNRLPPEGDAMRHQPCRERDRIADNLDAALSKLKKEGKEWTDEYRQMQRWCSEARYGRKRA